MGGLAFSGSGGQCQACVHYQSVPVLLKDLDGYGDTGDGLTDDDAVPEVRPDPVTKPGDLWLLGEAPKCPHCGAVN